MITLVHLLGATAAVAVVLSLVVLVLLVRGDRTYRRHTTVPGSPEHALSTRTEA